MNQANLFRVWAVLGAVIAVVVGLGLLLAFVGRGPGPSAPAITPTPITPTDDSAVARVDGRAIQYSFWVEAVLLDQIMSGLAGQRAPTPGETLQRLINEELVLAAFPPEEEPTVGQVEAQIITLEQAWGVEDAAVMAALAEVDLTRVEFERAVGRLLQVQASLEILQSQGLDLTTWLEEHRASAEIEIFEDIAKSFSPTLQSPLAVSAASPMPTPTVQTPEPSPTPVPSTETPQPTPELAVPEIAPDFTLPRASGCALTLTEQLAQGPVALVFFQKGGG
jgi:hypothetical protein